ncbi:hypothetical protein DNTS_005868, partial [Danionella cerebrum]
EEEEEEEVKSRIIGGQEAWAHSWPWQASLQYTDLPACGGAILHPLWLITASHCFKRYLSLYSSRSAFNIFTIYLFGPKTIQVEEILPHKDYNTKTNENDIALVKLESPLKFNECVRPVGILDHNLPSLESCTVTGWGAIRENGPRATTLQEVNVTVFEHQTCNRYYSGKILPCMFCAGLDTGGMDACQGDSGGPLSCFMGERYKLAGVVSWGVGCGRAQKPGVYTSLSYYKQWIEFSINGTDIKILEEICLVNLSNIHFLIVLAVKSCPFPSLAQCGQTKVEPCQLPSGFAQLAPSKDGSFKVENVSEACAIGWPWQASLQSRDTHYCSGVLVHPRWVLAPRHCLAKAGDIVVLGAHDLNIFSGQTVAVESVQSLTFSSTFPLVNDLSMIRLSAPARIGSLIFPVCLTDKDEDLVHEDVSSCVTTGWGTRKATLDLHPDILHMARVKPLAEKSCQTVWTESFNVKSHLCMDAAASASCLGDSGAPLVCTKNGVYNLVGLTAWSSNKCDAYKPAVFTRVSAFYSWIQACISNA